MNRRKLFAVLLSLQVVYLTIALLTGVLPGWSMFAKVENPAFTLTDATNGQSINVDEFLPPVHYELSPGTLKDLAVFICQKQQRPLSLRITVNKPESAPSVENYEIVFTKEGSCAIQIR